jgi:hypothetical protein
MIRRISLVAFSVMLLIGVAGRADAGILISIQQVGSDVVATGSGSVDLAGLTLVNHNGPQVADCVDHRQNARANRCGQLGRCDRGRLHREDVEDAHH